MEKQTPYPKNDHSAQNGDIDTIRQEVLNWIDSGRTGLSSKTIALHMAGVDAKHKNTPSDPSDFRRCMEMLQACPSIRNISELADKIPHYAPYVREWNNMVDLYESDKKEHGKASPNLYDFMKRVGTESTFINGRVAFGCVYMTLDEFEEITGVKPTNDNLFNLNELGREGLKVKQTEMAEV